MNKTRLTPALWGGILIGLIGSVPGLNLVNCMCCAGVISGGLLAVYLHRRAIGLQLRIAAGAGIELGLLAGLIGTFINAVFTILIFPHANDMIWQYSSQINNPELNRWLETINPANISRGIAVVTILLSLVVNTLFGLLGGLLGVSFWGSGKPGENKVVPGDSDDSIVVEDNDFQI